MCGCQPHVMLLLSNAILMEHTKILFPDINDRNSMYIRGHREGGPTGFSKKLKTPFFEILKNPFKRLLL